MEEKPPLEYKSELTLLDRYNINIITAETYYPEDSGGMEGMPGIFLNSIVRLENITEPCSPVEELASRYKIILVERNKEITTEPRGYTELFHEDFVRKIQENPKNYIAENILQEKVKEKL